jgi:hypothetical protein
LGLFGFVLGTVAGQLSGAFAYHWTKTTLGWSEIGAAAASGVATSLIAALVYVPLRVHDWAGGSGSSAGLSAFLAVCMGLVQAVLFRGRPLPPRA